MANISFDSPAEFGLALLAGGKAEQHVNQHSRAQHRDYYETPTSLHSPQESVAGATQKDAILIPDDESDDADFDDDQPMSSSTHDKVYQPDRCKLGAGGSATGASM